MSLFGSSLRPPAVVNDEAVERYVATLRAKVDPDPAFRRRLRGVVLNHYVAAREASMAAPIPRSMGRLGRAVLYASFVLGVSVTSVMAASEAAVPGDVLYPLKRAIEDMRVEVLPAAFHDALAAHELNERLGEMATLAERGDTTAVQRLAAQVVAEYESVGSGPLLEVLSTGRRDEVLALLLERLPEQARAAIDRVLSGATPGAAGSSGNGRVPGTGATDATPTPRTPNGSGSGSAGGGGSAGGTTGGNGPVDGNGDAPPGANPDEDRPGGATPGDRTPPGEEDSRLDDATPEPSSTPKPKKSTDS